MKLLIIDSHKSSKKQSEQNLHWINAKIISDHLDADFIWSYPSVNDEIVTGYDVIIFNHASNYSFESEEWLYQNKDARLFYVCNDYNLGEPITLWKFLKENDRKVEIIANHEKTCTKITKKYVSEWHNVNLNCLVYNPYTPPTSNFFDEPIEMIKENCIYYGTFRKDRITSFKKYLKDGIILSTHPTNKSSFRKLGCTSPIGNRIDWESIGLYDYKYSLCIEDDTTFSNYSRLPNRFYEALMFDVVPIFDIQSKNNVLKSGYDIPDSLFVSSYDELLDVVKSNRSYEQNMLLWKNKAAEEKIETLQIIKCIVGN